jgi:glucose-6-phosphate 1-dehydrogenase
VGEHARNTVQEEVLARFSQRLQLFRGDLGDAEVYSGLRDFLADKP